MSLNTESIDLFEDVSNPLDSVEEILCANDWVFDRNTEDELTVQVSGRMGEYKLYFEWQEEFSAMRFYCRPDIAIDKAQHEKTSQIFSQINSALWLGHFAFDDDGKTPSFRHTALFRGLTQTSGAEHLEDLVDIALAECERYYPVFDILARGGNIPDHDLSFALMNVAGLS